MFETSAFMSYCQYITSYIKILRHMYSECTRQSILPIPTTMFDYLICFSTVLGNITDVNNYNTAQSKRRETQISHA